MGFRAGPFVLCKDGCCHQRRRNTDFGPEKFFSRKNFPPHMCSQNDQRDGGIILSHVCWSRPPPPPGTAGRAAPAQTPLPARRPRRGRGGLGKWASVPSPPRKAIFFPPLHRGHTATLGTLSALCVCFPLTLTLRLSDMSHYARPLRSGTAASFPTISHFPLCSFHSFAWRVASSAGHGLLANFTCTGGGTVTRHTMRREEWVGPGPRKGTATRWNVTRGVRGQEKSLCT